MGVSHIYNYILILILIINGVKMSQSPSERKIMFGVSALSTTVFLALSILVFVKAIYMALPITIAMMLVSLGPLAIDYKKMKG